MLRCDICAMLHHAVLCCALSYMAAQDVISQSVKWGMTETSQQHSTGVNCMLSPMCRFRSSYKDVAVKVTKQY